MISTSVNTDTDKAYSINVGIGNDGKLTQTCQNEILAISADLINSNVKETDEIVNKLKDMALSIKSGNIAFDVSNITPVSAEFSIIVSSPDLLPEEDVECGISVALKVKLTLNPKGNTKFNTEYVITEKEIVGAIVLCAVIVLLIGGIIAVITALVGLAFAAS